MDNIGMRCIVGWRKSDRVGKPRYVSVERGHSDHHNTNLKSAVIWPDGRRGNIYFPAIFISSFTYHSDRGVCPLSTPPIRIAIQSCKTLPPFLKLRTERVQGGGRKRENLWRSKQVAVALPRRVQMILLQVRKSCHTVAYLHVARIIDHQSSPLPVPVKESIIVGRRSHKGYALRFN